MRILQWLLRTDSGVVDPILRITLAVVIFPQHGAQKVFGWFGGHGFKGTDEVLHGQGRPMSRKKRTRRSF
jgi:putative oxidoreductase